MNKKIGTVKVIYALLILTSLVSCQKDIDIIETSTLSPEPLKLTVADKRGVFPNILRVKFSPDLVNQIEAKLQQNPDNLRSLDSSIDKMLEHIGAIKMRRAIPYAGVFEGRHRRHGLHLWYEIDIEESGSVPYEALDFAIKQAQETSGIEVAEAIPILLSPASNYKLVDRSEELRSLDNPSGFNDPELPKQWHYHNVGQTLRSVPGADINLFNAWKVETGKPNVIVAIVDGGIDYKHEDLRENMFINLAEMNGTAGVDDDNNGKIDDIYGYNFVAESGSINAHEHGTHVAGTVAARNNNGLGVAGVAGGDGTPQSGIRLLSCQMFDTDAQGNTTSSASSGSNAIIYGADMGAVISQNSWGYTNGPGAVRPLGQLEKNAIDYFVKNAGCDTLTGEQLPHSPMKGGVVIFAAGNEGRDGLSFPAAYDKVIAVSSMAPDFSSAYYSNRGDWVDIMAPGGSIAYSKGEVLSTLPNNEYGYLQGTSMACPHVSGIAALIVSKYGGQGFTNEDLKRRLLTALRSEDINSLNPRFAQRLGAGYIDAAMALVSPEDNQAPETPEVLSPKTTHTGILLSWYAPKDANDGSADSYNVYYSALELNESNYRNSAEKLVVRGSRKAGDKITYEHQGLGSNTTYYYAIEAVDRWGLSSPSVTFTSAKTLENQAPVLEIDDDTPIRLTAQEEAVRIINVKELDGHKWKYELRGEEDYDVKHRLNEAGDIELRFRVSRPKGNYSVQLIVTDELGLSSSINFPFEFYKNRQPEQKKHFERLYASVGKTTEIDLAKYFEDIDGDRLIYSIRNLNPDLATAIVAGNRLQVKALKKGTAGFDIEVRDPYGLGVKAGLTFDCVDADLVMAVYPTLVRQDLNIKLQQGVRRVYVSVVGMTGKVAIKERIIDLKRGEDLIKLDLRNLPTGTYKLLVETKNRSFAQSFIKR